MRLILHNRCTVHINRYIPAKCLIQQIIFRSRCQIFISTYHMGNAHQVVIDYIGKVIGWHPIGFNQNLVIQCAVFYSNISINLIMECGCAFQRHFLTDDIRYTGIQLFLYFFRREIPAVAVIHRRNPGSFLNLPHLFQPFLVTEAVISVTRLNQLFCIALEHSHPLGLYIRANRAADVRAFVPFQTSCPQGIINDINSTFHVPFLVRILNSKNEISVILLRNQISIQCSPQISDVHIARWTGGKSCSNSFSHDDRTPLFRFTFWQPIPVHGCNPVQWLPVIG